MQEQLYLTFSLDQSLGQQRYSIDSTYLEEMLPLPEITLLPTASKDIIGVLNLRGERLPILDLSLSLGHAPLPYRTTDSIIVLKQAQLTIGLIVSNIGALETSQTIEVDASDGRLQAQRAEAERKQMISGKILTTEATNTEQIDNPCWLLNAPEQWIRYVEVQQLSSIASILEDNPAALPPELVNPETATFCPKSTPEERAIFQQRAVSLQQPTQSDPLAAISTLAIVTIEGTYFGVDLSAVKEFTDIQSIAPIPCCPPYIVGNTNLRGDILTLIDLGKALSESPDIPANTASPIERLKVMVIETEQYVVGILVDSVLEAMFPLNQRDIDAPSHLFAARTHRYLQGEFSYGNTAVGVLDMPKLLNEGNLIVDETVL